MFGKKPEFDEEAYSAQMKKRGYHLDENGIWTTDNIEGERRLKKLLLDFIEKETKEPSQGKSTEILPDMVRCALRLFGYRSD